jgi:hypothetical protein
MAITLGEGPNQSKTSCLVFTWDWSHQLVFPPILLQIFDDTTSIEVLQEGEEALRFVLVNTWHHGSMTRTSWRACSSYSERRHLQCTRRRSWAHGSTIRRVVHDDALENPTHGQEVRRTTTIGFKFPQSLKNSVTMFQAAVRQPGMTDLIDGPTRPLIGTPSMTTRSSGLALSEMRTMKPKESTWSSVAIRNRSIPLARAKRTTGPRWQNAASLNRVALHLSLDFNTVRL